ncbi:Hypothetical predicted protein [Marmota monax]|uniref:Interferon-related developmental regulator C-terminal domain-containing protein n=1 Tax=Marmota monax TaxID=9995 RepID=A0A5E4AT84_MARMO|nr:hypothetical protein GHT09_008971 [Marmota monax]VTJ59941.1 Hypothetical predicted protein [Marmota monax]
MGPGPNVTAQIAELHCVSALGLGCYVAAADVQEDIVYEDMETLCGTLCTLATDSNNWARHQIYAAFKDVLGSGMHHHLQNNELLRDIFGLGPVLVLDDTSLKACKISCFEKHLYNAATFKGLTKAHSCVRDKWADIL